MIRWFFFCFFFLFWTLVHRRRRCRHNRRFSNLMQPGGDADVALRGVEGGGRRRPHDLRTQSPQNVHFFARHLLRHHDNASAEEEEEIGEEKEEEKEEKQEEEEDKKREKEGKKR